MHALKKADGSIVRYQEFQDEPPVLAPEKGLVWVLEDQPAPPAPTPEQIEANRINALWQAAHSYEYAQVSGSAIGLLVMGVMQAKPKCMAVQFWIKSIWTEYYTRKATGSVDYNFDVIGVCPHSVPELMAELGL